MSDKRNPTVNANGLIFGATESSSDKVPVLDPVKNTAYDVKLQVRDPKTPSEAELPMFAAFAVLRRRKDLGLRRPARTACTTMARAG